MALLNTTPARNTYRGNNNNVQNIREESPFAGRWINVGAHIQNPDTGETVFVKLPMGIPFDSLKDKKIYDTFTPEQRLEAETQNQMVAELRTAVMALGEGESLGTDALSVEIYCRNEPVALRPSEIQPLGLFANKPVAVEENGSVA